MGITIEYQFIFGGLNIADIMLLGRYDYAQTPSFAHTQLLQFLGPGNH